MASLNQLSEFTSNIIAPKGKASKDIMEDIQLNRAIAKNTFTGNRIIVTSEKGVSDSSELSHNDLNKLDGITSPIQTQINDIKSTISSNIPNVINIHLKDLIYSASNIENQVSSHLSSITLDNIANGTQNKFIVNDTIHGDINVTGRITANNLEVTDTYTNYVTDKYVADNIIVNDGNETITDASQLQPGAALTLTQNGLQNILEVYSQKETTTNNLTVKQNGRVGMGTANPTEILDIRGDVQFSGTMNGIANNEFSALANTKGNIQEQINALSSGFVGNSTSINATNQITSNIVTTVQNKVSQQITISSNNAIHYYENICENKQDNLVFGNGLSIVNDTLELTTNMTTAWTDNINYISYGNVHVYGDKIIIGDNTNVVSDIVSTTPVVIQKYPRELFTAGSNTLTYTDGTIVSVKASTLFQNWVAGNLFSGTSGGAFESKLFATLSNYLTTTGVAKGGATNGYRTGYDGDYVIVDLGETIYLNYFKLYQKTINAKPQNPTVFRLFASNDANVFTETNKSLAANHNSWVQIFDKSSIDDWVNGDEWTITPAMTTSYRYYMIIFNKIGPDFNGYLVLDMLEFYGSEISTDSQNTSIPVFGDVTTDMVAWYKFEGDFTDSSGNGNDLTGGTGTSFIEGKIGTNSISFPNTTTHGLTSTVDLSGNKSFSIAFWSYRNNDGDNDYMISTERQVQSINKILIIGYRNTNVFTIGFFGGNSLDTVVQNDANIWVHWTVTYNPTNLRREIYKNGVLIANDTSSGAADFTGNTLNIGYYYTFPFNGKLDDFRVYNRVLTEEEVTDLYNYVPGAVKSSLPNNQVATLDSLDNKQTSLRWMGISRMLFNNFEPNVAVVSDQYGKVNDSDISVDSLNKLSDVRSDINNQINTLSNNHESLRNNLQSANDTWNTNTSNYIKNTVQTAIDTISTSKLSTDVVFSTGFIQNGNNISLDGGMTISSESVGNTSSTYWELHYKYGSNIPPEIISNTSFGDDTTDMYVWYKFNGDLNDDSGYSRDAIGYNSPTFDSTLKKEGTHSVSFAGGAPGTNSQYLTVPGTNFSLWDGFSLSLWVMFEDNEYYARVIDFGNDGNTQNIVIWREGSTSNIGFSIRPVSSVLVFQNVIQLNTWFHITVSITKSPADINVYINGNFTPYINTSPSISWFPNTLYDNFYIAKSNLSTRGYFKGKLDDFRIYNRALTPDEVTELYNYVPGAGGTTNNNVSSGSSFGDVTTDMLAWYKLDGDVTDSSGNGQDLNIVNSISEQYDSSLKKIGSSSMNFNSSLYATVSNDDLLYFTPTTMTLSIWIYNAQIHTSHQGIASARYYNSGGYGWTLYILPNTGELTFWIGEGPGRYWNDTRFGYNINQFDTEWTHIVVTLNNNIVKFYINNVFISESTIPRTIYYGGAFHLGSASSGDFPLQTGTKLDDFRLYNRVLTVDEISELYNYVPGAIETPVGVPFYTDTQNLLLWYKFDKNNFTTNSGNLGSAYDVTQNSALVDTSIRMKGDGAANLDGSYMIIQSDLDFTANTIISICFWTKITQLHSEWDTVLYKEMSPTNAIKIQRNAATNYWSIQFGAAHATTDGFLNDFTLDDASWRHYCFTFIKTGDNVTFKIFKNAGAEPVFTQEVTNTWPSVPIGKVSIGDPTYPLRHFIDDLRFYDRQLIAEELDQLYKYEPPVVDYITYKNTSDVVPDKYLKYYPDKLAITYNLQSISTVSIVHNDVIEEPTAIPGSGGYKYFAFTSTTGTNSITFDRDTVCDILIVGGGGGGGSTYSTTSSVPGAGGGAGGLIFLQNQTIPKGEYTVTVGNGGDGDIHTDTSYQSGKNGENSSFSYLQTEAIGGGGGGSRFATNAGNTGGSGGGSTINNPDSGQIGGFGYISDIVKFDGTIIVQNYRQGYDGGEAIYGTASDIEPYSGGGGGAGESGKNNIASGTADDGDGGDGISGVESIDFKSFFGITDINIGEHHTDGKVYFAGGGGAGYRRSSANHSTGGLGGGADSFNGNGLNGKNNTGGGGSGCRSAENQGQTSGGDGGSGIVIIRWYSPENEYPVAEVDDLVTKQDVIHFGDGLKYNSTTKELTAGGWKNKKTHVSHGDVSFAQNTLSLYKGERVNTYAAFQPLRKYPDVNLTAATTVSPYTSQNHIVQWSSEEATQNYRGHHLFNGDRADVGWISGKKYYKDGDTIPVGSVAGDALDTSSYIGDDSDNYGEWVKIELDKAIYLSYVQIYERRITGWSHRNPVFYVIYGSNDGNTWTQLIVNKTIEATYSTDADRVHTSEKVVPTQKYKHFAITVTRTNAGSSGIGDCGFAELEFYGNEHINVSTSVVTESLNTSQLGSIETNNVITKNISSVDSGPINLGKHIEIHNTTDTMSSQHMMMSSNITNTSSEEKSYCMRAKRDIWIDGADIVWTSDERIKKNIRDIDDDGALQKILAIEPKTYKYIDHLERGKNKVYGFISQQVRDVIPEATTQTKKYIPNIYKYCPYFGKTIVLPKGFDISTIVTTYNGKLLSDKLRLISSNGEATDVLFVLNGDAKSRYTMTITGRIPGDGRDVFVYGTEIDDMTTIDKSYIYTLNVCATQILSRKTDAIDANSSNLLSRTSELEQRIADIESKMSNA